MNRRLRGAITAFKTFVLGPGAALAPRLHEARQDSVVEQLSVMLHYGVFAGIRGYASRS